MSRTQRLAFLAIAVVIAVVAVVVLAGGSDKSSTTSTTGSGSGGTKTLPGSGGTSGPESGPAETATPAATVASVVLAPGKVKRIGVKKDERVTITVRSDKADEVHIHGYDIKREVAAGGEVVVSFKATITGIFEIELEQAREKLASLVVEP
jgi:hypothetical protein